MKVLLASEPRDGIRVVLTEFKPGEWATHLERIRELHPPKKGEFFSGHYFRSLPRAAEDFAIRCGEKGIE